ncbi:YybS family protein [Alsobacter sp. SYSU M60028]|uniref:YybS family protein n=1 Tax=Alsobacter ponti TaxID=2962936 RepID=A0ABT1LHA2_9HYPH|nr:DUF2232 domain-containing protein [Alsobacter ponti]MCP8940253.1 YybS family protein [Alsobacter ponti]
MGTLLGIGAGAGFVSALLFAVLTTGNPIAFALYFVAPLPVLLAALGWNHRAGLIAALSGAAMVGLAFGLAPGLLYLVSIAAPAWLFAYLLLLARSDGATEEWYPLGRLLLWIVGVSAGLTLLGALMISTDYDGLVAGFAERVVPLIERMNPNAFEGLAADDRTATVTDLARLLAAVALPISTALSVGSSIALLWLAARIVRASGRLPRPWPAIARTEIPRIGLALLGVGIVGGLVLSGFAGLFARSVAAAALMAYCLQGLAVVHVLTTGVAGRGGILSAVYITFFILPGWPVLLYALAGVADSLFGMRARKLAGSTPSPPTPTI